MTSFSVPYCELWYVFWHRCRLHYSSCGYSLKKTINIWFIFAILKALTMKPNGEIAYWPVSSTFLVSLMSPFPFGLFFNKNKTSRFFFGNRKYFRKFANEIHRRPMGRSPAFRPVFRLYGVARRGRSVRIFGWKIWLFQVFSVILHSFSSDNPWIYTLFNIKK